MRVHNRANLSAQQLAEIKRELVRQANLQDVMRWALADKSGSFVSGVVADVVVQDEFTHDVIIPWRDGLVLVYDTT